MSINEHYYSAFWCSNTAHNDADEPRRCRAAPTWQNDFLAALAETGGSVQLAAQIVQVSRQSVYYRRATDPDFSVAMAAILAQSRRR